MNANSARGQDETFKERTYGTGRRILMPPGVSTRNHYKRRASLCSGSFLPTMAEEALLEAHFALLSAQVRYHQEIVWLKRRRQQRQQKERRRLWCREWLGPLRRRQFGHMTN